MAGIHVILCMFHLSGAILIINVLLSILPINVINCSFQLSKFIMYFGFTKLTLGISKKIFLSGKLKPHQRAVLITGCARGIGHALAKHLDSKGFNVFASCRDLNSVGAKDLRKSCSNRLQVLELDVASEESVLKAVQFVKENLNTCELWAIINNAGIHKGFLLELSSMQDFKDCLEVNALGPARVTRVFLPLLRHSRGLVINIESLAGRLALPISGSYSMSKFACVGLSESIRYELDLWGVQVISIQPEVFETDMSTTIGLSKRLDDMYANMDGDVRKDYGEEFLKAFKGMVLNLFPPSTNMQKLIETVESAVSLKHPDAVYKVCRNIGVRAFWTIWDVLPEEFKVLILRIVFYMFGLPKREQKKKNKKEATYQISRSCAGMFWQKSSLG